MLQRLSERVWDGRWGYVFIAPAMIPFIIFTGYPLVQGVLLSFYKAGVNRDKWHFIGLKNYTNLLTRDPVFPTAIKNTFLFVLGVVPAAMIICLFVAVLIYPLSQRKQTFFRAAFYMPVVSAGVVLAMVWVYIYSQEYGLLNYVFESLGLLNLLNAGEKIGWLAHTNTALLSLAIVVLSWSLGQPLILFLAGLGAIPEPLYDAAKIDGASSWQAFWKITLPLLRPTMPLCPRGPDDCCLPGFRGRSAHDARWTGKCDADDRLSHLGERYYRIEVRIWLGDGGHFVVDSQRIGNFSVQAL